MRNTDADPELGRASGPGEAPTPAAARRDSMDGNLWTASRWPSQSRDSITESMISAAASALHLSHQQQLGLMGLVCLIFLEVSGGPFGTEEAVQAAGPLISLLGFIVLPFLWSIPEALVTAELATAFPENSGYVVWVQAAFGPFLGFMTGFYSWISGVTDNTIYPVMFLANIRTCFPGLFGPALSIWWIEKLSLMVVSFLLTALNYRGLDIVGTSSQVIVACTLVPFVLLTLLAIPSIRPSNWLITRPASEVNWLSFFNVLFWNLNSWDSVSTLAGEVKDPGTLFPKALFYGVQMVIVSYTVPLAVAIGVSTDVHTDFSLGYFGHVAHKVGGAPLAIIVLLAAAVSQIGQFEAEMSSDSYQVLGMAERGYLPCIFAVRSRYGTPIIGILLSSLGIVTMLLFSFMEIVEMLNAAYAMSELLEFAAFIYLRIKHPEMPRVFRVPLPTWALILMLCPASLLLCTVLVLPILQRSWRVVLYTIGVTLLGCFVYALLQILRRTRLLEFERAPALELDKWPAARLALALTAFPIYLAGLYLKFIAGWPAAVALAGGLAAFCAAWAGMWVAVEYTLKWLEGRAERDVGATLLSIPENDLEEIADLQAPLMRTFLQDAETAAHSSQTRGSAHTSRPGGTSMSAPSFTVRDEDANGAGAENGKDQ